MDKAYLSKEKYKEIQEELERLKTEGRKTVAERLKAAKDLGDLSENSDYQEARDDQMRLEMRVSQLEEVLRNASIVEKRGAATAVRIGTTVTAKKGKDTVHYTIVGSNEADPARGLVSNESPIGKALIGKRAGESAEVLTPKGSILLEITSIE